MYDLRGKRVLVTGGTGFLGKHLVESLRELGSESVDAYPSSMFDLTKDRDVLAMFYTSRPNVVIHAAADVGGIEYNRDNPGSILFNNLTMNTLVTHYAQLEKVDRFVGLGSVCSYPRYAQIPTSEDSFWAGYPEETNAPYGISKRVLLSQMQAYRAQYGLQGCYLVLNNLYGPGDHFNDKMSHVIPAMIYKVHQAKVCGEHKVVFWGDGTPTREFLYVKDAVSGIIKALLQYDSSEPVNVGSSEEVSVKATANLITKYMGFDGEVIWDKSKPNGQPRRCFTSNRASERFGFIASTSFEDGLKSTIDWYLARADT